MLHAFRTINATVNTAIGLFSGFALFVAGIILFIEVICRYSGYPTSWIAETSVYLFAGAMLLGAPYTLMRERHVRVELLVCRLSPRTQDAVYLITALGGMAFCLFVAVNGWVELADVVETGETTATTMRVPLWVTDMPLPIAFSLLSIQFFLFACERAVRLRQGDSPDSPAACGGR